MQTKHATREQIEKLINDIPNEDETADMLANAMEYYCGTYDKCAGFKHALLLTLADQYDHHNGEQAPDDLDELLAILSGTK